MTTTFYIKKTILLCLVVFSEILVNTAHIVLLLCAKITKTIMVKKLSN